MSAQTEQVRTGCLRAGDRTLPLTRMEISGHLTGLLHRTKVCQTFFNDHKVPLEAVYIHPLPPKAAVHGFRLVIGDRVVEGRVQERAQARQAYAEAVAQGHRAALMEEERSDIFTTTVGNIAPGEQVSITFELSGPLEFLESTASLRFPLVVPEVYISGAPLTGGSVGEGIAMDTHSVPDASRITPPRLAPGAPNPVDLRLSFTIDPAGLQLEKVDSLCHFARVRRRDDGCFELGLLPGMERLDQDFVVRLKLKENTLQTTLISDPASGAFALTVVPPVSSSQTMPSRDLVIVLDRSGSMKGFCMTAARRAAARMVDSLTPRDRFAIIAFDYHCEMLDHGLVPATARNQQRAQEFLASIEARGGTEAYSALLKATQLLKGETSSDRTILFITDGDVGNDAQMVAGSAGGIRVSTVGIGTNMRSGVLESMAKVSGGLCSLIPDQSTLEEQLRGLHLRLGRPHWMGLAIAGVKDQTPRFWDVWEGMPATFFGKAPGLAEEVKLEGWWSSTGRFSEPVTVHRRDDLVIHRSWARSRLLDLDDLWTIGKVDQQELVALSVESQILCRFTAFAAIDHSEVVADSESLRTVVQPVEPTLGVRLESAMPCPPAPRGGVVAGSAGDGASLARVAGGLRQGRMLSKMEAPSQKPVLGLKRSLAQSRPPGSGEAQSPPAAPPPPAPSPMRVSKPEPSPVWRVLLELLDQLVAAKAAQRETIMEKMVDTLGDHCRKLPSNSAAMKTGKDIMSLLLDLQQSLYEGPEATQKQVDRVRQALESLAA